MARPTPTAPDTGFTAPEPSVPWLLRLGPAAVQGRDVVRFFRRVLQSFIENRCQVRAAALAYTTLLALVPLLAVSMSVASLVLDTRSNNAEEKLAGYIDQFVENVAPSLGLKDSGGDAQRAQVARSVLEFTRNIHFGTIGVTSMVGLVFVAIGLLRTIEATFNDIWGATRARGWFQSVVIYWAAITLGPIFIVVASTSGYVNVLYAKSEFLKSVPGASLFRTSVLPLVVMTFGLAAFYIVMPNTRVTWRAAIVGGGVAALLWWGNHKLGALYNTQVVTHSKIYGSLGAVPLFLVGLYVSWLILIFGAQTAYSYQHRHAYAQILEADSIHQAGRELAAVRLLTEIARRFDQGLPRTATSDLAEALGIPTRLATRILAQLATAGLVAAVDGAIEAYSPARPLARITALDILEALRTSHGRNPIPPRDSCQAVIEAELAAIRAAEAARARTVSLESLVEKARHADASLPNQATPRVA